MCDSNVVTDDAPQRACFQFEIKLGVNPLIDIETQPTTMGDVTTLLFAPNGGVRLDGYLLDTYTIKKVSSDRFVCIIEALMDTDESNNLRGAIKHHYNCEVITWK